MNATMTCERCGRHCRRKRAQQKRCDGCRRRPRVTQEQRNYVRFARIRPDRNDLVVEQLPLAKRVAKDMHARVAGKVDYDDLLSGACLGLLSARDNFDPAKSCSFSTLARRAVPGGMVDMMRAESEQSRLQMDGAKSIDAARNRHYAEHGCYPTDDELRAAGVTAKELDHGRLGKIDRAAVADAVYRQPDEAARADWWLEVCRGLTRTEKAVVLGYFRDGLTMKETGRMLGLSETRISQLLPPLLARMKQSPRVKRLAECANGP